MKVYEGTIITCDKDSNVFRYCVEDKGDILHVGNELPEQYSHGERILLGDTSLTPSFADTHIHFASYALFASGLDIRNCEDLPTMQGVIKDFAAQNSDPLLVGFGASTHSVKEKRLLSREEIDQACPDRPVFIVKYDGHAAILNSPMIAMLPKTITSLRGFHAESGEMNQEAFFAVTDFATKKVSLKKTLNGMISAVDKLASRGIGMIHTVSGVGFPRDMDVDLERTFARGQYNPLQIRVFFQTMDVKKALKRKLPRIGGCFATALDGCFGSMDAAMNQPYRNDSSNRGVLFYDDEAVTAFTKDANRAGLQIEMHAIGDASFDQAVKALGAALKDHPREDHRHTIIHACLPTKEGLEKCAELGIAIALQPSFIHWNLEPLEYIESIMGDRAYRISPLRTMTDMGIVMSGGSDGPCTEPDPVFGIWAACNHYVPEESVTVQEALTMFTRNAAWTSFDENERGSLEKGKKADMVILNRNPLAMKKENLLDLSVEKLILSGHDYIPGQSMGGLLWRGITRRSRKI
ncbi:MAG TPA: amidohydrolase [Spirochaetota bacterium]|nr:amidohydrolase [Spirochaetota bacterium]